MNIKAIFALPFLAAVNLPGHLSWLQPDKFVYKRTEPVNVKFMVGENFIGQNWDGDRDKINCMQLYYEDVVDKSLDANFGTDRGDSLQLAMIDEGTVMITLSTNSSFADLSTEEFQQYLSEGDGSDTLNAGTEISQSCVKTILQVGDFYTAACSQKTDLALDIVPVDNPFKSPKEKNFTLKFYFKGEELKKRKVMIWHKLDTNVSQQELTTNEQGEVKFQLSPHGEWMATCIEIVKLTNDPVADWQSYSGSLTWGYY